MVAQEQLSGRDLEKKRAMYAALRRRTIATGASPSEAAVARVKADQMLARYGATLEPEPEPEPLDFMAAFRRAAQEAAARPAPAPTATPYPGGPAAPRTAPFRSAEEIQHDAAARARGQGPRPAASAVREQARAAERERTAQAAEARHDEAVADEARRQERERAAERQRAERAGGPRIPLGYAVTSTNLNNGNRKRLKIFRGVCAEYDAKERMAEYEGKYSAWYSYEVEAIY